MKVAKSAIALLCLSFTTVVLSLTVLISCAEVNQDGSQLLAKGTQQLNYGKSQEALKTFDLALDIFRKNGQSPEQGQTLKYIGQAYEDLGKYPQALDYYQQALVIVQQVGNQAEERQILSQIGLVYYKMGEYSQALEVYQQAFLSSKVANHQLEQAELLHQLGSVLKAKKQPELAIAFYKQSVNLLEELPENFHLSISQDQFKITLKRFANTYRQLADLLLQQNRILEAQVAADSLKVQELDGYLQSVRSKAKTPQRMEYLPPEQQVVDKFNQEISQVVKLGKELNELKKIPAQNRTSQQEARRQELEATQRETLKEFLTFSDSPEVVAHLQQLNRTTGGENLNPKLLRRLQATLQQLSTDAVLIYPLILEDRLEVVLVTAYTPPIHRPVPVKPSELDQAVADFRDALINPSKNAKQPGQKLYNWLIKPIEPALAAAKAKTIIYAPDGQLRYIPLAALYDGKQWLAQKYQINNITALSLTDLNKRPENLKILAGAFTKGNYDITVGKRTLKFGGLPFAAREVESITSVFPGSTKLLNSDFNKPETLKRVSDFSILHFATHAAFLTGAPSNSFILFGDGEAASLEDLRLWNLTNIDLVVLSACETGLGGKLGDGIEILGFGYVMQEAGAEAAIASLWQVADDGTQQLMNNFYAGLKQEKLTKAEALQKAQLALINSVYDHPYYWSAFILLGNGF